MMLWRRGLLGLAASALGANVARGAESRALSTQPNDRRVGIAYALWHKLPNWEMRAPGQRPWGHPELGYYVSSDQRVLTQHATWLSAAHVDFVLIDWSNDLGTDPRIKKGPPDQLSIENDTAVLFSTWQKLSVRPKIAFLIGVPGNTLRSGAAEYGQEIDLNWLTHGELKQKADQIFEQYVDKSEFRPMLETYLGKPLLVVMIGVPTPFRNSPPNWNDPRFTVRFMTASLSEQQLTVGSDHVSRLGYWSWEDRAVVAYSTFDGHAEEMTVTAAWRPSGGRKDGKTFRDEWARARKVGPRFVLAGTFNEWWISEQPNAELSKDIEPSTEYGTKYLNMLRDQAALFKAGK
jgi:hypothetical protein